MRLALAALAVITLAPGALHAGDAENRKAEIGVGIVGLSVYSQEGETITVLGAPNTTFVAPASVYASFFVTPRLALEPQLGVLYVSQDGESYHIATFAGQVGYFFKGRERPSPYVFGRGSFTNVGGDDDSDTGSSFGGGLGYRFPVGGRALLRLEGRFDHRLEDDFNSDANTFSVSLSLGMTL
jgi:hypothetical protein